VTDFSGDDDTKVIFKDARTGKIVSEEYATKHPNRTYALEVPEDDTEEHDVLGEED
jgi:hypothetical protein